MVRIERIERIQRIALKTRAYPRDPKTRSILFVS